MVNTKVLAFSNPKRVLLYRCLNDGEFTNEYAVELEFAGKREAEGWLKRNKLHYAEIEDEEDLP